MSELLVFNRGQVPPCVGFIGHAYYTGKFDKRKDGSVRFLTSGDLVTMNDRIIDVFVVGAGGGGGKHTASNFNGGGGAGYTETAYGIEIKAGVKYHIEIGQGGAGAEGTTGEEDRTTGEDGEATTAFGVTAAGGKGGLRKGGGDGGSGGGTGDSTGTNNGGGMDGGNGRGSEGGAGQGKTTRAFEDANGDLYATGGNGGAYGVTSMPGEANTGNGGDGGAYRVERNPNTGAVQSYFIQEAQKGGSGIAIIRKAVG